MFGQLEIWEQYIARSLPHVLHQNKFQMLKTFVLKGLSNKMLEEIINNLKNNSVVGKLLG